MRNVVKKMKGLLALILALNIVLLGVEPVCVNAETFNYEWIGSASSSGSFSFSDGSKDSAGYGYSISGVGKVFCINQGSNIYNNDNYEKKSVKEYVSEGKDDFSYEAVLAKICYYYQENRNSAFAQSMVQALIWQVLDKGYSSKSALKKILGQSSGNANDLFDEIFAVDGEIKASITTYKSSGNKGTQRMAYLEAKLIKNDARFGYVTYERSMTYRQIVKFHKVDADGKPLSGVVFAVNLTDVDNLYSVSMQKGEMMCPKNVENLQGGFETVYEVDAGGKIVGTKVTKSIDQIEDSFKKKNGETVIYVKSDSNGDVRFRLSYKVSSQKYVFGKYKEGDGKWQQVKTYEQMQKLSDNTNSDVMVNGHTYYYWMKKAFADSGEDGNWVGYRKRAKCNSHGKLKVDASDETLSGTFSDLRTAYEGVNSYIGIAEVKGVDGNAYNDNTLSVNPELNGEYKWINIKKDESLISKTGNISVSSRKSAVYISVGNYTSANGGTYTNSDYVDYDTNTWLSLDLQDDNDNYYSADRAKITELMINVNGGIVNAYYRVGMDVLNIDKEYLREFSLHKIDEDGEPVSNAEFDISIKNLVNKNELKDVVVNGMSVFGDESFDMKNLCIRALSDDNGDINIKLFFEKKYEGLTYGYGKYYDYNQSKYVDVKSIDDYNKLSTAVKSGIKDVLNKAYENNEFKYFDEKTYSMEGASKKIKDMVDSEFEKFLEDFLNEELNVSIKEVDVVDKDYLAINKDYKNGKEHGFLDGEVLEIVDSHKHFSANILKIGPDGVRKLDGAVFAVYEDEELTKPALFYDKDGKVINKNGEEKTYETLNGELTTDYLRCKNGDYYLKEVKAPDGYVSIYDDADDENDIIKISCDGSEIDDIEYFVDEAVNVEVTNETIKVKFIKKDADNKKGIDGAKITIKDKEGNVVYEFTSNKNGNLIEGILKAGEQYVFHEEKAPKGYEVAGDIKVDIGMSDEVQMVEMFDEKISVVKAEERGNKKEDTEGIKHTSTPKTGMFIAEAANEGSSGDSEISPLLTFILFANLVINLLVVIILLRGNKNEK